MHLLQAVLMGLVQGFSEFLPISSSAHLVFTSNFYKTLNGLELNQVVQQEVFLDIMLHLGTLISVLIFFRKDVFNIIKALYIGLRTKDFNNDDFKLGCYIILGTILTILVSVPLSRVARMLVFMPAGVGLFLVITGFILLFSEWFSKRHVNKKSVGVKNAILTGIAQGIASLPGFSRSGLTIATGLITGLDRTTAARYSFLLSIPIILGASMIYPLINVKLSDILTYNWLAIILGTMVSAISGYLCIKYFMKFLEKFSLAFFGYYCIIMGIFAYLFFIGRM